MAISSLSLGFRLHYHFDLKCLKNVYANISCFFCSFTYRGKVIIKGVSNIIGIGYSITIVKGEYSWYTGCYSFYRKVTFKKYIHSRLPSFDPLSPLVRPCLFLFLSNPPPPSQFMFALARTHPLPLNFHTCDI